MGWQWMQQAHQVDTTSQMTMTWISRTLGQNIWTDPCSISGTSAKSPTMPLMHWSKKKLLQFVKNMEKAVMWHQAAQECPMRNCARSASLCAQVALSPLVTDTLNGKTVPVLGKTPVWMFENGDMYLGPWKMGTSGWMVENGFGVTYNKFPQKYQGMCFIGEWKDATIEGFGKCFWLKESYTWRRNYLPASPIRQKGGDCNKCLSRPFVYVGHYQKNRKSDPEATVILKDGTTRIGPWEDGVPVGDWWNDHESVPPSTLPVIKQKSMAVVKQEQEESARSTSSPVSPRAARAAKRKDPPNRQHHVFSNRSGRKSKRGNVKEGRNSTRGDDNDDDDDDNDGKPAALETVSLLDDHDVREDAKNTSLTNLASWLQTKVIGYHAHFSEMREYARQLDDQGFHSKEMASRFCTEQDVESFGWMKPIHKRAFSEWLLSDKATEV